MTVLMEKKGFSEFHSLHLSLFHMASRENRGSLCIINKVLTEDTRVTARAGDTGPLLWHYKVNY
jgi:hypothetical protein